MAQDRLNQLQQNFTSVSFTAVAGAMWPQSMLEEAKALLEQLPHFRARLEDPPTREELQQIRSALFAADHMLAYSGHAFTCPNGHTYFIGECAGAMQASRCPECGSAIGGSQHRLAAGNSRTDF